MIYLVVALHCEAKPLIEYWGLNRNSAETHWTIFENSQLKLIISGVGKVLSAMAVESLINSQSKAIQEVSIIINFGTCGAIDTSQFNHGDIIMINKVADHGSRRCYYPDMTLSHQFKETGIETFDKPVDDSSLPEESCVDMESSGFFQAAIKYFPVERIICLKIVSDFLDITNIKPETIQDLITHNIPEIVLFIENLRRIESKSTSALNSEQQKLLSSISDNLRLTQTQRSKLVKSAEGHLVRTMGDLSRLEKFRNPEVTSKRNSKMYFNDLESILNEDVFGRQ